MFVENFFLALALTTLAGLSTGIGSFIAFFTKHTNKAFLSMALGFSAGVMIYISFVELMPESLEILEPIHGRELGAWIMTAGFFGGVFFIALIDRMVPEHENPHEARRVEDIHGDPDIDRQKLQRMGILTALAIAIHNFPEGMATFFATLADPTLGIAIAIGIALHNIPEGIAVAVPIYYATRSRAKAFWLSLATGLAEPLGALIGFMILRPFMSPTVMGLIFAFIAGIMVFISLDELFPAAKEYDKGHLAIYALVAGMLIMAITLLLLM